MALHLNAHEARVLGVLVEKSYTTPDQYPLSLNAATNGSNQKSNRNPVVVFTIPEVTVALQGLQMKQLAGASFPAGGRVEKWRHSAKQHLGIDDRSLAVLTELLIRGPQAPGELRTRASRMCPIATLEALSQVLEGLIDKGFAQRVPPGAGSRVERFGQCLASSLHPDGEDEAPLERRATAPGAPSPSTVPSLAPLPGLGPRVEALELEVADLRRHLDGLAAKLGEPLE